MAVLIVGGAGYIGSHQVELMCKNNYEVIVLDNLSTGFKQSVNESATFIEGDVRDYNILKQIFTNYNIDSVIHFAAASLVGESMELPLKYYDNNVYGMQVLLQAMHDFKVKNIIFSSTAAVYGVPEEALITEQTHKAPINTYGETKLAMEKMIKWASEAHDINYVAFRYFNVCGASDSNVIGECHNPETHLIPLVLQVVLGKRDSINIFGDNYDTFDGTCVRDYIHVSDLVDAHIRALEYLKETEKSDVFNLGYGHGYSVRQIIDTARKVTQHEIPEVTSEKRAGDPASLVADCTKAKEVLGWVPKHDDIENIIMSAYKFYVKYPNGYDN